MPGRQKTGHRQNKNRDNGNDTSSTLVNVKDIVSVVSIGKSCSPLFAIKSLLSKGQAGFFDRAYAFFTFVA